MNKILIPTDFSRHAETALKTACMIANTTDAELLIIHVMLAQNNVKVFADERNIQVTAPRGNEYLPDSIRGLKKNIKDLINELPIEKERVGYEIVSGSISKCIVDKVENENVTLILMGSQGEEASKLVGSNAEKIVSTAPCPVLTVRSVDKEIKFDKVVFATDLKLTKLDDIMEKIRVMKKAFSSEFHLVYVNTPSKFIDTRTLKQKAEEFKKENQFEDAIFSVYCDHEQDDGIVNFANDIQADLIIMISHQRKGFARLLSGGSVSVGVVNESPIPVLTYGLKN